MIQHRCSLHDSTAMPLLGRWTSFPEGEVVILLDGTARPLDKKVDTPLSLEEGVSILLVFETQSGKSISLSENNNG